MRALLAILALHAVSAAIHGQTVGTVHAAYLPVSEWFCEQGGQLFSTGAYREAALLADSASQLNPESGEAWYVLCRATRKLWSIDRTLWAADRAVAIGPHEPNYLFERGMILEELGRYSPAIRDYDELLRQRPSYAWGYYRRGTALLGLAKSDAAILDFDKALEMDPDFPHVFSSKAWVYNRRHDYGKAVECYERMLSRKEGAAEDFAGYARLMASCEFRKYRNGEKSVLLATRACEMTKWNDVSCLDTLAAAYAENGDFPSALKYANMALTLETNEDEKFYIRSRIDSFKRFQALTEG